MPEFRVEAVGEAREVYNVIAEDEAEAREKFARGELPRPVVSEVTGMEVVEVDGTEAAARSGEFDCSGQRAGAGYNTDPRE